VGGVALERFVYLHDLDVQCRVAGQTMTVAVRANDLDVAGVRPVVEGATALVFVGDTLQAEAQAGEDGMIVLSELRQSSEIEIRAEGYNPRRFRAAGSEVLLDLRAALYGASG